ncbi:sensor histidine kinase [Actinophytocola sp.]|uniref:sensor histidine kinase n=1 Tax=Actinophytocola sp. TaxID=1872138 RepID=UPI002D7EDA3F|nr:sensor histidine kinase [Actinophytocola sp.]HET9138865.1 sensor histidine kinase [Actinophytocola sp.]
MHDGRPMLFTRGMRRSHLIAIDILVAVGPVLLIMLAVGDAGSTRSFQGPGWFGVLVAVAIGLPIGVRRIWPLGSLTIIYLSLAVATVSGMAWGQSGIPFLIPMALALYSLGLLEPRRRSVLALVACLAGTTLAILATAVATEKPPPWETPAMLLLDWLLLATPWAAGRAVRARRADAVNAAEQLARQAVSDERLRIARELHDIVAHSLSLITVKASVANHVARDRPDEARDALRIIEDTSRDTMIEMRRLLGVLRSDSSGLDLAPSPGLGGLRDLADRAGMAGVRVDLDVHGPERLPDGVELSIYRIVQEALTNVVKHAAPAHCRVRVDADERAATVTVVDDGPGVRSLPASSPGHGLIGMRERVMMYDGEFAAGPGHGGGFTVTARLPYRLAGERT